MALPPLATVSDLAAWVGREIPDNDPRAGAVLSHASTRVRSFTRQTWDAADVPDAVQAVTVRVAARAWQNPENLDSVTVDDGTKRWGVVRGLALTDEDREDLAPYVINPTPYGIGILSTYRDDPHSSTLYVPTAPAPSGEPFPFLHPDDL